MKLKQILKELVPILPLEWRQKKGMWAIVPKSCLVGKEDDKAIFGEGWSDIYQDWTANPSPEQISAVVEYLNHLPKLIHLLEEAQKQLELADKFLPSQMEFDDLYKVKKEIRTLLNE